MFRYFQEKRLAKSIRKYMDSKGYSKYYETTLKKRFPALTDKNVVSIMIKVGAVRYVSHNFVLWGIV